MQIIKGGGTANRFVRMAAIAVTAFCFTSSAAQADTLSEFDWAPNVHISLDGQAYCDNSKTTIKLWGTFTRLLGLGADVTFTNSYRSQAGKIVTSSSNVEVSVTFATDPNNPIVVAKNGEAKVGGNPYISIGFNDATPDGKHVPITGRIFVGRCVMGNSAGNQFKHIDQDLFLGESVKGMLSQIDCNQKGPTVALGTAGIGDGLSATVYLDNNKNYVVHETTVPQAKVNFGLVPAAGYAKNARLNSAGGNPLVDLFWKITDRQGNRTNLLDENGNPIGIFGKRCNKI